MLYLERYQQATGRPAPLEAERLEPLFARIAADEPLPPRSQQAVDLGLPAHSLSGSEERPALYQYYRWVLTNCFAGKRPNELTAKLIGMAFVCNQVFKTDLPQPITLNPWQSTQMQTFPLATNRAVIVENNSMFILLATKHPDWPLINQGGNDFQLVYVALLNSLEARGVALTYLGDLDSRGIQMADTLYQRLNQTPLETFLALQTTERVSAWIATFGESDDVKRVRPLKVNTLDLQSQMNAVTLSGRYVDQEKLLPDYEKLMTNWLKS